LGIIKLLEVLYEYCIDTNTYIDDKNTPDFLLDTSLLRIADFSGNSADAFADSVDVYYYLSNGRPFQAFELFHTNKNALQGSGYITTNDFDIDVGSRSPYKQNRAENEG
jgi:hypothetical protein